MTPRQLEILQHSLGVDQYGQGRQYRNHFYAGGLDVTTCRELAEIGLMREFASSPLTGGDPAFFVTSEGKRKMAEESPPPPKRTRAQQRYDDYLKEDSSMTFGEWIKRRSKP